MKTTIVLSAFAIAGIQAQAPGGGKGAPAGGAGGAGGKGGAPGASGGNSGIMSALGGLYGKDGVPLGPAPKGCAAFEVMFGALFQYITMDLYF